MAPNSQLPTAPIWARSHHYFVVTPEADSPTCSLLFSFSSPVMKLYLLLIVCCVPHHVLWPLDDDWSFWPFSCNPEAESPWSWLYSCCLPVSVKSTSTMELYCSLATDIEQTMTAKMNGKIHHQLLRNEGCCDFYISKHMNIPQYSWNLSPIGPFRRHIACCDKHKSTLWSTCAIILSVVVYWVSHSQWLNSW